MLRISIESYDMDVPEDIKVDMKLLNPIFSESGYDESFSYSFNLPKTAKNSAVVRRLKTKNAKIRIVFNNFKVEEGIAVIKTNMDNFSVAMKNDALDARQQMDNLSLEDLDLDVIPIAEVTDDAMTIIGKWHDHMVQTTITDDETIGSHKFPFIQPYYNHDQDDTVWSRNLFHGNNALFINSYNLGTFESNTGYDQAVYPGPNWVTTISPCIRIAYLLEKILAKKGLITTKNELLDIPEYLQMIHFSKLVMDLTKTEWHDGNEYLYNIHGYEIDLNKFVPKTTASVVFKILDDLFGTMVKIKNGSISIELKRSYLKGKWVDMSKWCNPEYEIEGSEGKNIKLIYPIDYNQKRYDSKNYWSYTVDSTLGLFVWVDFVKHATRTIGKEAESDERELNYIPLNCIFDYNYATDKRRSRFATPDGFISSYFDPETYNSGDQFFLGLIRGKYPMKEVSSFPLRLVFENSHTFPDIAATEEHEYSFGSCSIFASDPTSHVDVYLKEFFDYVRKSKTISKTLYLPLHRILELRNWKESKHIIKQRNLSFKGVVKEVNFTLYKNAISPCTIHYAVVNEETSGDFSGDYNDDFTIE